MHDAAPSSSADLKARQFEDARWSLRAAALPSPLLSANNDQPLVSSPPILIRHPHAYKLNALMGASGWNEAPYTDIEQNLTNAVKL